MACRRRDGIKKLEPWPAANCSAHMPANVSVDEVRLMPSDSGLVGACYRSVSVGLQQLKRHASILLQALQV